MAIDSFDVVVYTAQFVVPGYIVLEIIESIMPRKKYSEGEKVLQSIGYSVLNLGIWHWLFSLIDDINWIPNEMLLLVNTLLLILTGAVTGILFGLIRSKDLVREFLNFIGIKTAHPIPTAWDYKFSDGLSYWVEVQLSDGRVIRGLYSCQSMASSDENSRDLYLEQLYYLDTETKAWKKTERTAGVWISPNEIRCVKFYDLEDVDND